MEDYETTYEEFWKELVENPDGSLNVDQVKRELHDYECLLSEVPQVFCHVTGGLISKPNTKAEYVIEEFENFVDREVDERVEEAKEQVIADVFAWIRDKKILFNPVELYGTELITVEEGMKRYLAEMKKS